MAFDTQTKNILVRISTIVDKSLFIRELLLNFSEVNQITRPRRFGKTLNMSMLKCFFEIGSDTSLFDGL